MIKHIYNGALLKLTEEDEQIRRYLVWDHPFALPVVIMLVSFMTKIQVASCSSGQRPVLLSTQANFADECHHRGQLMVQSTMGLPLKQALPDAIHSDLKAQVILKQVKLHQ